MKVNCCCNHPQLLDKKPVVIAMNGAPRNGLIKKWVLMVFTVFFSHPKIKVEVMALTWNCV